MSCRGIPCGCNARSSPHLSRSASSRGCKGWTSPRGGLHQGVPRALRHCCFTGLSLDYHEYVSYRDDCLLDVVDVSACPTHKSTISITRTAPPRCCLVRTAARIELGLFQPPAPRSITMRPHETLSHGKPLFPR